MKLFLVVTVARQIEGEYVFVNVEKVFKNKEKAVSFIYDKPMREVRTVEVNGVPNKIDCLCERSIIEADLEDSE